MIITIKHSVQNVDFCGLDYQFSKLSYEQKVVVVGVNSVSCLTASIFLSFYQGQLFHITFLLGLLPEGIKKYRSICFPSIKDLIKSSMHGLDKIAVNISFANHHDFEKLAKVSHTRCKILFHYHKTKKAIVLANLP